jgi:hypothetical protein
MRVRGSGSSEQVFHNSVWKSIEDVIDTVSYSGYDYSSSSSGSSYDSSSSSYDSGSSDCGGGCGCD